MMGAPARRLFLLLRRRINSSRLPQFVLYYGLCFEQIPVDREDNSALKETLTFPVTAARPHWILAGQYPAEFPPCIAASRSANSGGFQARNGIISLGFPSDSDCLKQPVVDACVQQRGYPRSILLHKSVCQPSVAIVRLSPLSRGAWPRICSGSISEGSV